MSERRRSLSTSDNSCQLYYGVVTLKWSAVFLSWADARKIVTDPSINVLKYKGFSTFQEAQRFVLWHSRSDLGLHSRPSSPPAPRRERLQHSIDFITPSQSPVRDQSASSSSTLPITLNMGALSITVDHHD